MCSSYNTSARHRHADCCCILMSHTRRDGHGSKAVPANSHSRLQRIRSESSQTPAVTKIVKAAVFERRPQAAGADRHRGARICRERSLASTAQERPRTRAETSQRVGRDFPASIDRMTNKTFPVFVLLAVFGSGFAFRPACLRNHAGNSGAWLPGGRYVSGVEEQTWDE
jgi:hypothetical protein